MHRILPPSAAEPRNTRRAALRARKDNACGPDA